jgi:hypothetical protein
MVNSKVCLKVRSLKKWMYEKMNQNNQKTLKCDLIVKNPKNPNLTRFYSKFPIDLHLLSRLF